MHSAIKPNRLGILAFTVYCLLTGFFWLLNDTFPGAFTIGSLVLGSAAGAVILLSFTAPALLATPGKTYFFLAGILFGADTAYFLFMQAASGMLDRFVPLSFIPLLVWFFTPRRTVHLFAALAFVAATLLVFPFQAPTLFFGWIQLLIGPLSVAGAIAVAAHGVSRHKITTLAPAGVVAFGTGLVILLAFIPRRGMYAGINIAPTLVGVLYSAAAVIASSVAIVGNSPLRFTSFYPATTLLTMAGGFVFFFRDTPGRMWIALVVLVYAIVGLWRNSRDDAEASILHLG